MHKIRTGESIASLLRPYIVFSTINKIMLALDLTEGGGKEEEAQLVSSSFCLSGLALLSSFEFIGG